MRSSTLTIDTALAKDEIKLTNRLTVYKSRLKFNASQVNRAGIVPAFSAYTSETPMPEAVIWNSTVNEYMTAFPDVSGNLCVAKVKSGNILQVHDSNGDPINIGKESRISMFEDYVYCLVDEAWKRIEIDYALVLAGTNQCVSSITSISPLSSKGIGAIHAVTATEGVLFSIDEGGISIVYWNMSPASSSKCPSRFFQPTVIYGEENYSLASFSAAVLLDGVIYCYITHYSGEVKGISYRNSVWSDTFTAIPSDLSVFSISNAIVVNDAIFLCGTFSRTENFVGSSYLLLEKSIDGTNFTMDANKLVTIIENGERFLVAASPSNGVIFSSGRQYYEDSVQPYYMMGEATDKVIVDGKLLSGGMNEWMFNAKSGSEQYFANELIISGAYAKLEIGIHTTAGLEWIKYHDVVVSSVSKGFSDGVRENTITITTDGKFHSSMMTYPFYIEKQGRQSIYSNANEFDKLYKLSGSSGVAWAMSVDFWESEAVGAAFSPRGHAGGQETVHLSQDLKTKMFVEYPEFGSESTYVAKIYGWSRAGVQDTNPNTPDYTPVDTPNDKFYLVLEMQSKDGSSIEWIASDANLLSTYANPPQTYFIEGARPGSYPVEFTVPNPGEGTKIIKVGVKVVSGSGNTLYYLERVEFPGITAIYPADESVQNPSFQIQEATTTWPLVESIPLQITTGNAVDGDVVSTSVSLKDGYCYAFVIEGQVGFDRDGKRWIQDAEYYCNADLSDDPFIAPDWGRNYPPGTGATFNSAVVVDSRDFPYFDLVEHVEKLGVKTKTVWNQDHKYSFKHADLRFKSSSIKNTKIPYVYSGGEAITISLYLAGSGSISGITDGAFVVHVFESPVPFNKFKYYGGHLTHYGGTFEVISNERDEFIPGHDYHYYYSYDEYEGSAGNWDWKDIRIRPTIGVDLIVTMKYTLTKLPSLGDTQLYEFWNALHEGDDNGPHDVIVSEVVPCPDTNVEYESNNTFKHHFTGGYDVYIVQGLWYPYPHTGIQMIREVTIEVETKIPTNPQVPVPPSFILVDPDGGIESDDGINKQMLSMQKGVPQVLFATSPYAAYNFDAVARMCVEGAKSYAGIVGLAVDEKNYIVGYFKPGAIGIAKVRSGVITTLHEENISELIETNKLYDIRFTHRDGVFMVDLKSPDEVWGFRGTYNEQNANSHGFTYEWKEADGPLSTSDDIFHVGIYGYINPSKFRTTGFLSSMENIPILPADINPQYGNSDVMNRWVDGSPYQVDIQGAIYNYATVDKTLKLGSFPYMGPFQIRNIESWEEPFNNDRNGKTYIGGRAVEITFFKWLNGVDYAELFKDAFVASAAGYSWKLDESQWKVWITTGGEVVWLRNRSRHYSDDIPDYFADGFERFYITDALGSVTPVSDVEFQHPHGAFVYLHSGDYILLEGLSIISGDPDQSIRTVLSTIMKTSGSDAYFPGDRTTGSLNCLDGEEYEL